MAVGVVPAAGSIPTAAATACPKGRLLIPSTMGCKAVCYSVCRNVVLFQGSWGGPDDAIACRPKEDRQRTLRGGGSGDCAAIQALAFRGVLEVLRNGQSRNEGLQWKSPSGNRWVQWQTSRLAVVHADSYYPGSQQVQLQPQIEE